MFLLCNKKDIRKFENYKLMNKIKGKNKIIWFKKIII